MIVGGYTLHLYCDDQGEHGYDENVGEFVGQTEATCVRQARSAGWLVRKRQVRRDGVVREDRVLCPKHRRPR